MCSLRSLRPAVAARCGRCSPRRCLHASSFAEPTRRLFERPRGQPLCVAFFNGEREAAERVRASGALVACGAEFHRATSAELSAPIHDAQHDSLHDAQDRAPTQQPAALGDLHHENWQELASPLTPTRWDDQRCRSDTTAGVAEACAFSSDGWNAGGNAVRGSWVADAEHAAVLASADAVRTTQIIHDARELRFVRHSSTVSAA